MGESLDPVAEALNQGTEGFVRGLTLSTLMGQRSGSTRHQRELELQNALQIDDLAIRRARLNDLVDKGVVGKESAEPYLQQTKFLQDQIGTIGMLASDPGTTGQTLTEQLHGSKAALAQRGITQVPSIYQDFEKMADSKMKGEAIKEKNTSIEFMRNMTRVVTASDPAIMKSGLNVFLARLEKMGVPANNLDMMKKLSQESLSYMVQALSKEVIDGSLNTNDVVTALRGEDAPLVVDNLIKQGQMISAQRGFPAEAQPAGQATQPEPAGAAAPPLTEPASTTAQPQPLPGIQRLTDVRNEILDLKTDLRALETEGGKPSEVLALRKEIATRTDAMRTLEEEHTATIAETASKPVKSYVDRLGALGEQIDKKQQAIQDLEDKGLAKTPGGQRRIDALNKQIDEHNKQMDKMADIGPITKDEHLVKALQEGGVPVTDKRAVAKVMANKETASAYLQRADAIRKIDEVKKAKVAEGEKVHSTKVDDARGGHLQLYKVDEAGKVTNLSKIPLGRDPVGQTMTLLRARVAGLTTGIKEMDALTSKKAEDLLVRLNRADPLKAMLSTMLGEGAPPKAEDILKKR